jgi:hypothetical protein
MMSSPFFTSYEFAHEKMLVLLVQDFFLSKFAGRHVSHRPACRFAFFALFVLDP